MQQRRSDNYGTFSITVISASPGSHGDRGTARRHARRCLLAGCLAWPLASHAIGLGKLAGDVVIGESLQLEIPLTGTIDRPLGSECIEIRRSPDAVDPEYFPRDLVARFDSEAGTPRIILASGVAMRQPLVEFRIFVSCGYNLFHDYVLMATPRNPSAPAAPASALPAAATVVSAPVAASARLPDGIAGQNVVLDRDTTLQQLARRYFPGPLRQQRFMRWVVEANPQIFAGTGDNREFQHLPAGTSLLIPAIVPPRRPGDHQSSTAPAARQDRLMVGSGGSNARNLKQTVALIDQLTGMLEQQVAAQTTYNEKIRQLEMVADDLGKQLRAVQAEAAEREVRWQAERQAEKVAREQEAERAWWNLLAATLAGGIIGGGLLFALNRMFSRRQQVAENAIDLHPVVAVAESEVKPVAKPAANPIATPAAMPAKAIPLTEFGWDNDHPRQTTPSAGSSTQAVHIDFEFPLEDESSEALRETGDSAEAAIELANIMTAMGLTDSAAQTLVEHIRGNPHESLPQWLKLLEIHRMSGDRDEFERSAAELKQHYNVQPGDWNEPAATGRNCLEAYTHLTAQIVQLWPRSECLALLRALLLDNREGTRLGFPAAVAEEILLLIAILDSSQ